MSFTLHAHGLDIPIEGVTQEEFNELMSFVQMGPDSRNKIMMNMRAAATYRKLCDALCMTEDEWYATPGMADFVSPAEAQQRLIKRYAK
jgi:hypothetical protein